MFRPTGLTLRATPPKERDHLLDGAATPPLPRRGIRSCSTFVPHLFTPERPPPLLVILRQFGVSRGDGLGLIGHTADVLTRNGHIKLSVVNVVVDAVADAARAGDRPLGQGNGKRHTGRARQNVSLGPDTGTDRCFL